MEKIEKIDEMMKKEKQPNKKTDAQMCSIHYVSVGG